MSTPKIDTTNPEALMRELFDNDAWVKDQFATYLGDPLLELCEALAGCFRLMGELNAAANGAESMRTALVGAFVFGVLDDLVVSTKLLLTGKYPASGNLMRQVIEGIAISILCSAEKPLVVKEKTKTKPTVRVLYWERMNDGDPITRGHLAIGQLARNAPALGLAAEAVRCLQDAKDYYNTFSHCGTATLTNRVSLEGVGMFHLGGHFDEAKLVSYRADLDGRINLCRVLPPFMRHMLATMKPPLARRAAAAQPAEPA
ncbi:hypothetical protein RI103_38805 (plasmid) [Paraburkholderia sp. FT54]|uniref:hypothetical protein n=1 Tax=Paraburkholderia sp. FT54 TaxID=3074437 RepID=UPI0028775259|nr:hypothetical protein [Paraburkholderia sp. FT54]WNC95238.1 hypothetical protein RI103_38805 [Paraburkholderia sp. FT54]